MKEWLFDGETYRVICDDHQMLSAVRPEGERHIHILVLDKATGEIQRTTRILAWLNKTLREEITHGNDR